LQSNRERPKLDGAREDQRIEEVIPMVDKSEDRHGGKRRTGKWEDHLPISAKGGRSIDPGGFVQPGQTFTYIWDARPGTEGIWLYHDHGPMDPIPLYKGLMGPLIIRDPSKPRPDVEFFLFMHSLQPVATDIPQQFGCMNGRAYAGNTPTLEAKVGQRVAFHVIALDNDFHTFHIHGHRWTDPDGTVIDTRTLGPGDSYSLEFIEDNPGRWFYHCHVFSHLHMGMNGWYLVS
jgi:FtsP/CotA-like multicopper oxidase with cupredoxin domain